ncbi:hypothetical protein [Homoserinimonas hongtaonis]|uniref:Uncharacterized protein n=1 Tax=Homoserinimonas hongtaonis TaxID=2079791 RepID=A0A2U1T133_9MICO|nr:hypothetical protein [Salinibacterium hongtaonis]AWB90154.1 hypothetical protein C2138_11910 [Salinibacterium hongtaonis]PWB97594.1 hypothetical protein DF220_06940 [Salinibacterium hongtaonis]
MINGNAVLSIWHDIEATGQTAYVEWHVLEHMPERASIPGFVRGRRGVALDPHQSPKYVTLYEASDVEVFRSDAYLERLDNPTAWTQKIQPSFQNFVRFANEIEVQRGFGDAAYVTTARIEIDASSTVRFDDVRRQLDEVLAAVEELPLVASVALARSRDDITDYVTNEAELRPVNPQLDGIRHVAVISVDTATAEAAGAVRQLITAADFGDARVGHCSTFVIDYVVDADQVDRAPFTGTALDRRGRV